MTNVVTTVTSRTPQIKTDQMNRRNFFFKSSITAISLSAFGSIMMAKNGQYEGDCATTNDILGPFYRPDAPISQDLTFEGQKGIQIQLKGNVYGGDCSSPINNALVEIWHCDTEGAYDNKSTAFRHRARWYTNAEGEYAFKTIIPGNSLLFSALTLK